MSPRLRFQRNPSELMMPWLSSGSVDMYRVAPMPNESMSVANTAWMLRTAIVDTTRLPKARDWNVLP